MVSLAFAPIHATIGTQLAENMAVSERGDSVFSKNEKKNILAEP